MIRERIKWMDPVTQVIMLMMITILIFLLSEKIKYTIFAIFAVVLRIIILKKHDPGLIIENDYPGEFFIKPEYSDEPMKATPSTPLPIEADGIKIKDKVFKLRTGTNVKITKDGKVKSYSPISALVNEYVTEKNFSKQEWDSWKKLFEA